MDISVIKQRKSNLESEITQMLNNFEKETSCNIYGVELGTYYHYPQGRVIDNVKLDIRIN